MSDPLDRLAELMERVTKLSPLPWTIAEDSANGKEEAWCHWHTVGPFSMTGELANDDDRLVVAAINAMPALVAIARAAREVLRHCESGDQETDFERHVAALESALARLTPTQPQGDSR